MQMVNAGTRHRQNAVQSQRKMGRVHIRIDRPKPGEMALARRLLHGGVAAQVEIVIIRERQAVVGPIRGREPGGIKQRWHPMNGRTQFVRNGHVAGGTRPQPLQRRNGVMGIHLGAAAAHDVGPEGVFADDGNGLGLRRVQWKQIVVVFEQDDGFRGRFARQIGWRRR